MQRWDASMATAACWSPPRLVIRPLFLFPLVFLLFSLLPSRGGYSFRSHVCFLCGVAANGGCPWFLVRICFRGQSHAQPAKERTMSSCLLIDAVWSCSPSRFGGGGARRPPSSSASLPVLAPAPCQKSCRRAQPPLCMRAGLHSLLFLPALTERPRRSASRQKKARKQQQPKTT